MMGSYLEALLVCVNYGDYLAVTLPKNKDRFDRILVVTTPDDSDTIAICRHFGVKTLLTKAFYVGGDPFNKARALNAGMARLLKTGWVVLTDADVIVPSDLRLQLSRVDGSLDRLYSCRRSLALVPGHLAEIEAGRQSPQPYEAQPDAIGYGYLQAVPGWSPKLDIPFNESYRTAEGYDGQFRDRWAPEDRIQLEGEALHLGPAGVNWEGRVTPSW